MDNINEGYDEYTREEVSSFVGRGQKAGYYRRKWAAEDTFIKSWNWAAFFAQHFWFAYRKMYVEAALTVVVTLAFSALVAFVAAMTGFSPYGLVFMVLPLFAMGLFGNDLYLSKFQRIRRSVGQFEVREKFESLAKKGGTSRAAVGIFLAATFVLYAAGGFLYIQATRTVDEPLLFDGMEPGFIDSDFGGDVVKPMPMPAGDIDIAYDGVAIEDTGSFSDAEAYGDETVVGDGEIVLDSADAEADASNGEAGDSTDGIGAADGDAAVANSAESEPVIIYRGGTPRGDSAVAEATPAMKKG